MTTLKPATNLIRIAGPALAGLALSAAYLLSAPGWYSSTLAVVPAPGTKSSSPGSAAAAALGADLPIDIGNSFDVDRIAAVLQSRSVTDAVIEKFNLIERYGTSHLEPTRKRLWRLCGLHSDKKAKIISLTCEDKDPKFAQSIAAYFGEVGNEVFRRVNNGADHEEAQFLERRVAEVRKDADESARKLRQFEETHKIVDLEAQSKAVVSTMASLRGQEISKQLQLSYLNRFAASDEATSAQLRQQLQIIDLKLRHLDEPEDVEVSIPAVAGPAAGEGRRMEAARASFFPAAMQVPQLQFELGQLIRDRKIHETHLMLLMARLEQAKVNEARDTSAFEVLDAPSVATYRSHPVTELVLLLGAILGLLAGLSWALGPAYLRALRAAAASEPLPAGV